MELQELSRRLERLELETRQLTEALRQLKDGSTARGPDVSATAKNMPFTLQDTAGRERVFLGLDRRGNPVLMLRDEAGHERVVLRADESASLRLCDRSGKTRIEALTHPGKDWPFLHLRDENERHGTRITQDEFIIYDEDSNPVWTAAPKELQTQSLQIVDSEGRLRSKLAVNDDGLVGLVMMDDQQSVRAVIGVRPDGWAEVKVFDSSDKGGLTIRAHNSGEKALLVLDGEGRMRALLHADSAGSPSFAGFDEVGDALWSAP